MGHLRGIGVRRASLLLVALATACTLTTSFDGLTGGDIDGGPDAVAIDGGENGEGGATDAAVPDAEADAGTDGAAVADAATDARFCADASHAFCADFDDGVLVGWDGQNDDAPGTIEVSSAQASSPGFSLLSAYPRRGAEGVKPAAFEVKQFSGASNWIPLHLGFDVYLTQPDWQSGDVNCAILGAGFLKGSAESHVFLQVNATYYAIITPALDAVSAMPFPTDRWVHVQITLDPAGSVTSNVDGEILTRTFPASTPTATSYTEADFGVFSYNDPIPAFTVYYDNVTIDLK